MGMDRFDHVADGTAHLDGQNGFGDKITGAGSDDSAADDSLRFGID